MIFQEVLVFSLFFGAIGFIGTIFWKSLNTDSGNSKGCASCSVKDMKKVRGQFFKNHKRK
jgi:hypothetical protein